uniref:ATP synthase F0 subunit 8 n=1 Tax=Franciscoloa funerei TaxID=2965269 RepID=UPI00257BCF44|nr:ATP synthase F0 subunit 8 [Franciscoloa funerei]WGU50366.1 ATP synthase subunit 8 [Franciscoloa funerei]
MIPQMFPSSITLVFMFVVIIFFIFLMSIYWQVDLSTSEIKGSRAPSQESEVLYTPW